MEPFFSLFLLHFCCSAAATTSLKMCSLIFSLCVFVLGSTPTSLNSFSSSIPAEQVPEVGIFTTSQSVAVPPETLLFHKQLGTTALSSACFHFSLQSGILPWTPKIFQNGAKIVVKPHSWSEGLQHSSYEYKTQPTFKAHIAISHNPWILKMGFITLSTAQGYLRTITLP